MAWIESHQELDRHPKVLKLSRLSGWSINETIGILHRFWWWCASYAEDGNLSKYTSSEVASALNLVDPHATQFFTLLIDSNFLDTKPNLRVHDWWEYFGKFLQGRYCRTPKKWKQIRALYALEQDDSSSPKTWAQHEEPTRPNLPYLTKPEEEEKTCGQAGASREGMAGCPPDERPSAPSQTTKRADPPLTSPTWDAYRHAYCERYGADPVRNASVNAMLAHLVKRLGARAAPAVAAFYVSHNEAWYVKKRHPVNLLLDNCEGLHTQWVTGQRATHLEARSAEQRDAVREQAKRVQAMLDADAHASRQARASPPTGAFVDITPSGSA